MRRSHRFGSVVLGLLACALLRGVPSAMFVYQEVIRVPVSRLVANLEFHLSRAGDPGSGLETLETHVQLRYGLARVHAIAFAQRDPETQVPSRSVRLSERRARVWLPHYGPPEEQDELPPRMHPSAPDTTTKSATLHLERAIRWYRAALELDPDHFPSQLGLAWSLDQAGNNDDARNAYRKALASAVRLERQQKAVPVGVGRVDEVVKYLEPLLDPEKDAEEIARVRAAASESAERGRFITPILIPLHDAATFRDLVAPAACVAFDLDGSGRSRRWGWITAQAGWLVYDPTGNGKVRSGLDLIGEVTFWIFWRNGYDVLEALDDDRDGVLRATELTGLAIWKDHNSDGVSDPGEVRPLDRHGIVGLRTDFRTNADGVETSPQGVMLETGATRASYDWLVPQCGPKLP